MNTLSRPGAEYFCRGFRGTSPQGDDTRAVYESVLKRRKFFTEGDTEFDLYRDALLRDSDRSFFMAVSCFRRALGIFLPSSVFWAHVSLYYASWFAAQSTLAMYGCWVRGREKKSAIVIDVETEIQGNLEFRIRRDYPSSEPGSHQFFWDAYYTAMRNEVLWVTPELSIAVDPVGGRQWAISTRNRINYRPLAAMDLINDNLAFDPTSFPASLKGDVATQFRLARAMLLFCADRAVGLGLRTDVQLGFPSRAEAISQLVFDPYPADLSTHSERDRLAI